MKKPSPPWLEGCNTDQEVLQRLSLEPFTLVRIRRSAYKSYARLDEQGRKKHEQERMEVRFMFLFGLLTSLLTEEQMIKFYQFIESTDADVAQIMIGDLVLSPFIVRRTCAIFGIHTDYMVLGKAPAQESKQNISLLLSVIN